MEDRAQVLRQRLDIFRSALKRRPYAPEAEAYCMQIEKHEA